jgi:uncharacterized protein YpmB
MKRKKSSLRLIVEVSALVLAVGTVAVYFYSKSKSKSALTPTEAALSYAGLVA